MPKSANASLFGVTIMALLACVLSLAGFAGIWYFYAMHSIDRQIDVRLRKEMSELIGSPEPDVTDLIRRIRRRETIRVSFPIGYLLLDPRQQPLAGSVRMLPPPLGTSDVDFSDRLEGIVGMTTGRALAWRAKDGSELVLVADRDPMDDNQRLISELLAAGFVVSGLIVAGGMAAIMSATTHRLSSMTATAEAIMQGDMTRRLPIGQKETFFDREARLFNLMLDRIADLIDNLRSVSNDIAHDLRTPLGRLRGRLAAAETSAAESRATTEIQLALVECDQLLGLFSAILRLSEIESGQRRAGFEPVALHEMIHTILDSFGDPVGEGGRTLALGPIATATIAGDRTLLAQMVINAIDNAVRHTPVGTAITVSLIETSTGLALSIADTGVGIAAHNHTRAMRRFGKIDTYVSTGYGLGFSLIKAIADLHGAKIQLCDNAPGLIVMIEFMTRKVPEPLHQTEA